MAAAKKVTPIQEPLIPIRPSAYSPPNHIQQKVLLTGINPEYGTKKILQDRKLYTGIAGKFRGYDEVEIWAADVSWYATGRCTHVLGTDVRITISDIVKCGGVVDGEMHQTFIAKYKGINKKWCVIDTREDEEEDGIVFQGIETQTEALQKRDNHAGALNT